VVLVYTSQGGRYRAGGCINSKLDWDCLQSFVTKAGQNMAQLNLLLKYVAADSEAVNLLPKWV